MIKIDGIDSSRYRECPGGSRDWLNGSRAWHTESQIARCQILRMLRAAATRSCTYRTRVSGSRSDRWPISSEFRSLCHRCSQLVRSAWSGYVNGDFCGHFPPRAERSRCSSNRPANCSPFNPQLSVLSLRESAVSIARAR